MLDKSYIYYLGSFLVLKRKKKGPVVFAHLLKVTGLFRRSNAHVQELFSMVVKFICCVCKAESADSLPLAW